MFFPPINFCSSALLVVLHPRACFEHFSSTLMGQKRYTFIYAWLHTLLAVFLVFLATIATVQTEVGPDFHRFMAFLNEKTVGQIALDAVWSGVLIAHLLLVPLGVLVSITILAILILVISAITRSGFSFETAFNLVALMVPFGTFWALWIGLYMLTTPNGFGGGFLGMVVFALTVVGVIILPIRSFHHGAKVACRSVLAKDQHALTRFYLGIIGFGCLWVVLSTVFVSGLVMSMIEILS